MQIIKKWLYQKNEHRNPRRMLEKQTGKEKGIIRQKNPCL